MKLRNRFVSACLLVAAVSGGGATHAADTSAEKREEVAFRPWIGTLGVHFHSERPFEEASRALVPGERNTADELSGQANAAGLQGFGLGGEWRPFGNGIRLNFAMYLDSAEPGEPHVPRSWKLSEDGSRAGDPIVSATDFDAIPYLGLGWRTNERGVDVNLDVGAFLPGESSLRSYACLNPDSPLTECGTASFGSGRDKLSGSLRRFEWYPVVSLGVEYRF